MDCNYAPVESVKPTTNTYVPQYQPTTKTETVNPVFAADTVCLGNVPSPYETYSAASVAAPKTTEVFDISKYYTIPESEVIPKLAQVRNTINNTDLSAKEDIEKYNWIESKFADSFGENFLLARNLNLPSSMFYMISVEYTNILNKHFDDPQQVNRVRLYGDASTDEIKAAIRNKYPNTLSNSDVFAMSYEMQDVGVLENAAQAVTRADGSVRFIDSISLLRHYVRRMTQDLNDLNSLTMEERDRLWQNLLNNPVNPQRLFYMYNLWVATGLGEPSEDIKNFLIDYLGGIMGEDGLFILEGRGKGGYCPNYAEAILREMDEYEAFIASRLRMIDNVVLPGPPPGTGTQEDDDKVKPKEPGEGGGEPKEDDGGGEQSNPYD
jgi:hypothetical protein